MPGYISTRVQAIPPSGLLRFFDILATMDDVLSLGIGEPDVLPPEPVRQAGSACIRGGRTGYTSNAGILELRREIAAYLHNRYGVSYDPEREILVTVGVSEGLHVAMLALLNPGDAVLVPEPCFVAYDPCVRFADGVPLPVATHMDNGFQVTVEQLTAAITPRTRALLLSYPNNPTGAVMDRDRLLEVARFAAEHDLFVLSDEIYDRFVYGNIQHTCFTGLPGMWERSLLLGGFSKCYAMTGWRVGYACGPAEIIQAMHKVHQYIIMSAPTIGQVGALQALHDPSCGEEIIQEFALRREVTLAGLRDIGLPCAEPRGAIYVFPSIRETGLTSQEFSERLLLEEKVAVVPGNAFGPSGEGHVRIAYTVPLPQLEEALGRIERFVKRL